jgi:hypothetical protein
VSGADLVDDLVGSRREPPPRVAEHEPAVELELVVAVTNEGWAEGS